MSTPRATVDMASCSDLRISVFNMQNSWPRVAHLQNQPWENLQVGKVRRYRKSELSFFFSISEGHTCSTGIWERAERLADHRLPR